MKKNVFAYSILKRKKIKLNKKLILGTDIGLKPEKSGG